MVCILNSSAVDLNLCQVRLKTIQLVLAASSLNTRHEEVRAKVSWCANRIMCLSGVTCQHMDCYTSELS
jgi:hypothetical protein